MCAWRKMQRNESTQIARRLVFVDTETKPEVPNERNLGPHRLWFGVASTLEIKSRRGELKLERRDELVFYKAEEFWEWVADFATDCNTTWIYCHNAAFDYPVLGLLPLIANRELEISKPYKIRSNNGKPNQYRGLLLIDAPPFVVGTETRDGQRYVLCDTLNYWRTSLASIGRDLGFPKLEMPSYNESLETWIDYCRQDVKIIETAIVQLILWWKDNDLGNWRWTAPGLAMSAFRHKFMSHDIVFHDEAPVRALERESYFGGQLEAYYVGEVQEPVRQLDVVSLYPSVMAGELYPIKLKRWNTEAKLEAEPPPIEPAHSIAEVELDTPIDTFPIRYDGIVHYCNGEGVVTLAGPELAYAVDHNYVKRWGRWATYDMGEIFTDYVSYFYSLKEEYDKAERPVQKNFVKMLLNSLYGKFGQQGSSWQYNPDRMGFDGVGVFYESNCITGETTRCLGLNDVVLDYTKKGEVDRAAPSIAAFVTSYARQKMRRLRQIVGDGHYYYQSTDSLIVDQVGYGRLLKRPGILGSGLGQLKEEKSADGCLIEGLHWYRIGDKIVEGSKKGSAISTGDHTWRELQFESFTTIIGRQRQQPHLQDAVIVSEIEKERRLTYNKGAVQPDGWVTPHTFSTLLQGKDECIIQETKL